MLASDCRALGRLARVTLPRPVAYAATLLNVHLAYFVRWARRVF